MKKDFTLCDPSNGGTFPFLSSPVGGATLRIHDDVAAGYNSDTGIIGRKNAVVCQQLNQRWAQSQKQEPLQVVDLGVGDGALLARLRDLGHPMTLTGLDISPAMLALASQRLPLHTVLAPAEQAAAHLPAAHFDLVLVHFILAYVPLETVLRQAHQILKPGGTLSLVTSTHAGTQALKAENAHGFYRSRWPWYRAMGRAVDQAVAASHVPLDAPSLEQSVTAAGLEIERRTTLEDPVHFDDAAHAFQFMITEGWGVNILGQLGRMPMPLARTCVRLGLQRYRYPLRWVHTTEIVDIRKP
jgi:SAM-dependent methyltransferase